MKFKNYILIYERAMSGGNFWKYIDALKEKSPEDVEKTLKSNWNKLSALIKEHQFEEDALRIINKNFKSNFRSLDQINKSDIKKLPTKYVYEDILNEDFKHFWQMIKDEGFPVLAFYPCLQAWLELDKLLRGMDGDYKVMAVYGLIWALLVSGKFVKGWKKWKKENPKEWEKEGAKKNPFAVKKNYGEFEFEE